MASKTSDKTTATDSRADAAAQDAQDRDRAAAEHTGQPQDDRVAQEPVDADYAPDSLPDVARRLRALEAKLGPSGPAA